MIKYTYQKERDVSPMEVNMRRSTTIKMRSPNFLVEIKEEKEYFSCTFYTAEGMFHTYKKYDKRTMSNLEQVIGYLKERGYRLEF